MIPALSPQYLAFLFCPALAHAAFELEAVHPREGAEGVAVSTSIHLRFSDALDLATLEQLSLHEVASDAVVTVNRASDLTNASITLAPTGFLAPGTRYEIRGSAGVKSKAGAGLVPFRASFTTGDRKFAQDDRLVFEQSTFDGARSMTTVSVGPDGRLYAADAFGHLVVWDLKDDGTPTGRTILLDDPSGSRQYIDLEWDPAATADNLVLWVSYAERIAPEGERRYFTGVIARLEIADTPDETVVVTGLPHGREKQGGFDTLPHQPNGLAFRDGKLYQSVGSTSSSGGTANWGIGEQALSACILEIDYDEIGEPLDVFPGSGFAAGAEGSHLRVFATGVRNALEIVAHTNGKLYTAVNINDRKGRADGVPDDPDIPGDQNMLITQTTPDQESLYILEEGRYYGFPNPARGQFVLSGGNPTIGEDAFEITDYPVGTMPEAGFAPGLVFPIWQYGGTSPDGMIEYLRDSSHPLEECLFCCFYSTGDIAVLRLAGDGSLAAVEKLRQAGGKLDLAGPLDIAVDPRTGVLYIADFGKQAKFGADGSMVMLRPKIR